MNFLDSPESALNRAVTSTLPLLLLILLLLFLFTIRITTAINFDARREAFDNHLPGFHTSATRTTSFAGGTNGFRQASRFIGTVDP